MCLCAGGCLVVGGCLFRRVSVKVWAMNGKQPQEVEKTKCQNRAHKHRALAVTVSHLRGFELQSWGSDLTRLSYIWLAAQCTVTVV